MPVAAIVVGCLAFLIGFPILKLKGHYLAMATLGLGIIIYIVFNETVELTGGPSGLSGIPNLQLGGITFDSDVKNYYLIWCVTLAVMLFSINLANSRVGRALRAVHDSEVAAQVLGVNCPPAEGADLCPFGDHLFAGRQPLCPYHDLYLTGVLRLQLLGRAADHGGHRRAWAVSTVRSWALHCLTLLPEIPARRQ